MHETNLIQDLAMVMIVAALATLLFHRFRQPVVLGYLVAGFIVGPHFPMHLIPVDEPNLKTLSELGVILLLFSLGLHFSFRKLRKVAPTAGLAGAVEISLMAALGYTAGRLFGMPRMDCIFLGAMLSISSTTIIVRTLSELGRTREKFAEMILGILIMEDLVAIAMLALLSGIALTGKLEVYAVAKTLLLLGTFLVSVLVLGLLVVPRLLRHVDRARSSEMLLITALGLCFGVSLFALKMGYSVALGAFLVGAIVAETRQAGKISALAEPVRDMFSAIFFVTIGMMIDPVKLTEFWKPILILTATVIVGKTLTCTLGSFLAGSNIRTSVRVGMGLAQIGEFSFIIATLGITLEVTSASLYPIVVAVSALTTLTTPYMVKASTPAVAWLERKLPVSLWESLDIYSRWMKESRREDRTGRRKVAIRAVTGRIFLNIFLLTAVFITALYFDANRPVEIPEMPAWLGGTEGVLWMITMFLALPLILATLRNFRLLGMGVAGLTAEGIAEAGPQKAVRLVVARVIVGAGSVGLWLWVVILSSTLLPPWPVVVGMSLLFLSVAYFFWRQIMGLYSGAAGALEETLSDPTDEEETVVKPALGNLLKNAQMERVWIEKGGWAAGKMLRELSLRSVTGVSAVAIERGEQSLVNPGPDEEMKEGDGVLLLGTREQLEGARGYLSEGKVLQTKNNPGTRMPGL